MSACPPPYFSDCDLFWSELITWDFLAPPPPPPNFEINVSFLVDVYNFFNALLWILSSGIY